MGTSSNILIGIIAISLITFIALFGQLPALRRTPIGWLQRALCIHLPNGLRRVDARLTNGAVTRSSRRLGNYLFYQKNPLVLILFLTLLTTATILFLLSAVHRLPLSLTLPIPFIITPPYLTTYLSATHTSHHITPSTHRTHLTHYPYDHILYHPARPCRTCALPKPARSKHCSLCNTCIACADHHCPWINNCVGRGNYRYFLLLLLSLGFMELYGAYLAYYILAPSLTFTHTLPFFSQTRWQRDLHTAMLAIQRGGLSIAGVGLLCASTFLLPWGLLAYHCYLIWAGMTTNESQKWADWRDDMADGIVYKARYSALQAHNRRQHHHQQSRTNSSAPNPALTATADGDAANAPHVDWPISSDQILVTTNDGQPPTGQEALWTRVWSLGDVENLYDLGGWENLVEVLKGR